MTVSSVLIPVLTWAAPAMKGMEAEKSVPGIYKVILPLLLFGVLASVVGISVMAILNTLRKSVPLEDPGAPELGKLTSGEMTKYERESKIPPSMGKVFAIIFIVGLVAFMFGGMYTMGRGSGTTEQLRKEGKEKQERLKERKEAASSPGPVVGDDSDKGEGDSEFSGMLGGMK